MNRRLGNDIALTVRFIRNGPARAALVALCMALVAGLMLVAVSVLLLGQGRYEAEAMANVVADPGVRGGYLFALLLACIAPLTLLRQVVRLGTAAREQRLAALRLVGATPADVRRWGGLEVGAPALVGGLLGYPVFLALRAVFGGASADPMLRTGQSLLVQELRLVPTAEEPAWWHVLLVAALVAAAGALAGAWTTRGLTVSPLGIARRAPRTAPRPWGAALVLPLPLLVPGVVLPAPETGTVFGIAFVGLAVAAMLTLTPWVAYRAARTAVRRTSRPHVLTAAARLVNDPRPAGRAAAALGAVGLFAGAGGVLLADLPSTSGGSFDSVDPMYTVPMALGGGVLLVTMALVVMSLTVHAVESLVDHKRAVASLAATGATRDDLLRVQRWEVGLAALPVTTLGVLVGSSTYVLVAGRSSYLWIPALVDVTTVSFAWLVVLVSTRLTRPWLLRAAAPSNLRAT